MTQPDTTTRYDAFYDPAYPPSNEISLLKLFFNIAMFMVAAFITLEFGLMQEQTYTLRIESQLVPYEGASIYTLSDGKYQGCLDASVGELVIFVHKRGYVTNTLWDVQPHPDYVCK